MTNPVCVNALWDEEARVFVAESPDVPGLVTEADTLSALVQKLKVLIPELLDENSPVDGTEIPFIVLCEQASIAYRPRSPSSPSPDVPLPTS